MDWMVYLLSIIDGADAVLATAGIFGFFLGTTMLGVSIFVLVEGTSDADRKVGRLLCNLAIVLLTVGVLGATGSAFVPEQNEIMRAYMMRHGAEVVNAPNAEKAVAGFTKRIDRIINIMEKK